MSALKRKADRTVTITLRIPASIKEELDRLRPIADAQGFDVTLSLVDAIARCAKQIGDELKTKTKNQRSYSLDGTGLAKET
jgi:hypothetical protein